MVTEWNKQKDQGLAEGIATKILLNCWDYNDVIDVSQKEEFQAQDVDLLAIDDEHVSKIEVKNDDRIYETMNIFAEERRIYPSYSDDGWLNVTKADALFYRDANNEYTYILKVNDLKAYIANNKCRQVTIPDYKKGRKIKDVRGTLVNVYDFGRQYDLVIISDDLTELEFEY